MAATEPGETPSPEAELHRNRARAESFGADAEKYDRSRPRYPEELVSRIVAGSPGPDVVDVGCGTGIAARQFLAAGCRVLGVEVDARMAGVARRHGVDVEVAPFEAWDPAGRSFDAVISGQAWHWVDPVAGAAKAAGLLRPGGRLAVFWNLGRPSTDVAEELSAVYRRVAPELEGGHLTGPAAGGPATAVGRAADGIRRAGAFDDPEAWRFDWERRYTRDEWLDQLPTHSDHRLLSPERLAALLPAIGAAIDALGGAFTMGFTTAVATATRATGA
ncbi:MULTISPECIES: class I SAM-dependent methyltransferase [Pseudofrankia]|uniref:class I SAM-dependent methyltransferase n=1 Tax=Pseudofrankia TaxID=2994363 RepID=UPI000234B3D6|nr:MULTISPECIES: class I SAM-dependent methyltransferase [Pseudofrankia]OHV39325.1 methyltransferase type 11 [Pseudofrankia sp. EUN1h]